MDTTQKRKQLDWCTWCRIGACIVSAVTLCGNNVFAQSQNSSRLSFGYGSKTANFYGVYSAKPGSTVKPGLEAELDARAEGVKNLEAHLPQDCETSTVGAMQVQPEWKKSVRSLGSDIYRNSTIKISLAINIRDLFKRKNPTLFLPVDTETDFAFHLPAVQLSKTNCSLIRASLFGQSIWVQPLSVAKSESRRKIEVKFEKDIMAISKKEDADWFSQIAQLPEVWNDKNILEIPVSAR